MADVRVRKSKVNATKSAPPTKAVRLDLPTPDHDALQALARSFNQSMAAFVRLIVTERLRAEQQRSPGR